MSPQAHGKPALKYAYVMYVGAQVTTSLANHHPYALFCPPLNARVTAASR